MKDCEMEDDKKLTDRQLLELAAQAAKIPIEWSDSWNCFQRDAGPVNAGYSQFVLWRPLTDDGDALRLAVQLCMQVEMSKAWQHASVYGHSFRIDEEIIGDAFLATRRAIVRAAAALAQELA
jgi:hypothetical protein